MSQDTPREALAPCPFCGGTDIRITRHPGLGTGFHSGEDVYSMCCYDCGATFPNRYRRELLVEAWNRRAAIGDVPAVLDDTQRQAALSDEQIADIAERMEASDPSASFWREFARAVLAAAPQSSALPLRPLSDEHADAIHRMPYVRACLLEYVWRPMDKEAAAVVKAISTQVHALAASTEAQPSEGGA
jgi:Lar family restriction alleviation protein